MAKAKSNILSEKQFRTICVETEKEKEDGAKRKQAAPGTSPNKKKKLTTWTKKVIVNAPHLYPIYYYLTYP